MRKFFKALLKAGIYIGGFSVIGLGAPLFLTLGATVGVSMLAGGSFDRFWNEKVVPFFKGSLSISKKDDAFANTKGKAFSKKQWMNEGLPLDMSVTSSNGKEAKLRAAGIDGLVHATHNRMGNVFSFEVSSGAKALELEKFIRENKLAAKITRNEDNGHYIISSKNATEISVLARNAYPQRQAKVNTSVKHCRQYLVEGVTSYEEAVKKLKTDRDACEYKGSYVSVDTFIDGRPVSSELSGDKLTSASLGGGLAVGSYLVTESEDESISGTFLVPANVTSSGAIKDYYEKNKDEVVVNGSMLADQPSYVNGLNEDECKRYFIDESTGRRVFITSIEDDLENKLGPVRAFIIENSLDGLKETLDEDKIAFGRNVVFCREYPALSDGQIAIELDLSSPEIMESVGLRKGLPSDQVKFLLSQGISGQDILYSRLNDLVKYNGTFPGVVMSDIEGENYRRVIYMNTPLSELKERLSDKDLPELKDNYELMKWASDASTIQSVDFSLDPEGKELRVTSVVGNNRVQQVIPLDKDDDIEKINGRVKGLTMTQKKDFLMQFNPGVFGSYSASGVSLLHDPVNDFKKGRIPRLLSDYVRELKKENTKKNSKGLTI